MNIRRAIHVSQRNGLINHYSCYMISIFSKEPRCWLQLYWLIHRGLLQVLRDPSVQLIRIVQKVVSKRYRECTGFRVRLELMTTPSRIAECRDDRRPVLRRRHRPRSTGHSSHRGCHIHPGVREHVLPHVRDIGADPAGITASPARI